MLTFKDFTVSKDPIIKGNKFTFICGDCDEKSTKKPIKSLDRSNQAFKSATCNHCKKLNLFSDKHGNYHHWII